MKKRKMLLIFFWQEKENDIILKDLERAVNILFEEDPEFNLHLLRVLLMIARNEGTTQRELILKLKPLGMEPVRVNRMSLILGSVQTKSMKRPFMGLIEGRAGYDARVKNLFLTKAGRTLLKSLEAI